MNSQRYRYIDALRALAALLVLWSHTAESYSVFLLYTGDSGKWVFSTSRALSFGHIGVMVFFAISGFVIPSSIKGETISGLKRFFVSRFFRLYPIFWVSILPGALTFYWLWNKPFSFSEALLNFTMIPTVFGAQPAEGLYWSLQVELIFYALCAGLFCARLLNKSWCIAALMGFFVIRFQWYGADPLYSYLSIMLFGTLCRKVVDAEKKSKLLLAVVILYAASWVLAKPMWMLSLLKSGRISFEDFMSVVPDAMAVTTFCLGISVLRLESRFFAWLGERSYSIYLFHPVVFYSFYLVVINVGELGLYKLHLGLYVVIAAVLTILLSSLTYRFIEKPAIELARRINNRWGSKPSVQAYTKASV